MLTRKVSGGSPDSFVASYLSTLHICCLDLFSYEILCYVKLYIIVYAVSVVFTG